MTVLDSLCQSVVLATNIQRVYRMRKSIKTAARLISHRLENDQLAKRHRWTAVMVTLTYAPGSKWASEHVSKYIKAVQKWAIRKGHKLPYAWVMELHKSGIPHYHIVWWIPRVWMMPRADKRGWWDHGCTNTIRARNAYGYLSKYASKGDEKAKYPKGARIHGVGGLTKMEARIVAWWKLPKDLRLGDEGSHVWRRRRGGGWVCIEGGSQGEIYVSGYGVAAINAEKMLVRLVKKQHTPEQESKDRQERQQHMQVTTDAYREFCYEVARAEMAAEYDKRTTRRIDWIIDTERRLQG